MRVKNPIAETWTIVEQPEHISGNPSARCGLRIELSSVLTLEVSSTLLRQGTSAPGNNDVLLSWVFVHVWASSTPIYRNHMPLSAPILSDHHIVSVGANPDFIHWFKLCTTIDEGLVVTGVWSRTSCKQQGWPWMVLSKGMAPEFYFTTITLKAGVEHGMKEGTNQDNKQGGLV